MKRREKLMLLEVNPNDSGAYGTCCYCGNKVDLVQAYVRDNQYLCPDCGALFHYE